MKRWSSFGAVVFLVLTLLPATAQAQVAPFPPQITLMRPALPTAQFGSGAPNIIDVRATSAGSTIVSAAYQAVFGDPPGTFVARNILDQFPITPLPTPRTTTVVLSDNTPVPAGVPDSAVASVVIIGTVAAVDAARGEWRIGNPAVAVYESATTTIQGAPGVGAEVKVEAFRTLAPGPLVADSISQRSNDALPLAAPFKDITYLYNGSIESQTHGSKSPGVKLGGDVWTVGGVPFRIDDSYSPASIDPGVGMGVGLSPAVTVQFSTPVAVNANGSNVALEILPQVTSAIPPTVHHRPLANNDPAPVNLPAGTWKVYSIGGVVTEINADGEWRIGNSEPPIYVYQHFTTVFNGARRPVVGDDVRIAANRTLVSGPIVADVITLVGEGPQPPASAEVISAYRYNGVVQIAGTENWIVGNATFGTTHPDSPSAIDPSLVVGSQATVEFNYSGPPPADPTLWVPLNLDARTNVRSAQFNSPASTGDRAGVLYLRATDATQQVTTIAVPATLAAMPAAVPTAPGNLAAAQASPTQADLTWTDSSTNETSFRVERATDSAFTVGKQTFVLPSGSSSFTDTTLVAGSAPFYRVMAVNGAGETSSNVVRVTAVAIPAAPTNLLATLTNPTLVTLTWTDNSTSETGFVVQRADDAAFTQGFQTFNVPASAGQGTSVTFPNTVTAGTVSFYRVMAVANTVGSAPSNTVQAGVRAVAPAPSNLVATISGATKVDLTWVDNGTDETETHVERAITPDFADTVHFIFAPNVTSFSDTTVVLGQTYFYRTHTINAAGPSLWSSVVQVSLAIPASPAGLTATASANAVTVAWTDNSTTETNFLVERSSDGATWLQLGRVTSTSTSGIGNQFSTTDTTVLSEISYTYRVKAGNNVGDSAPSPTARVVIGDKDLPPTPAPAQQPVVVPDDKVKPPSLEPGKAVISIVQPNRDTTIELAGHGRVKVPQLAIASTSQIELHSPALEQLSSKPSGNLRNLLQVTLYDDKGNRRDSSKLDKSLEIHMRITDADIVAAGNNPANIEVQTMSESAGSRWEKITTGVVVDLKNKDVIIQIDHLSFFAIVVTAPPAQQPTPTVQAPATGDYAPGQASLLLVVLAGFAAMLVGAFVIRGARRDEPRS